MRTEIYGRNILLRRLEQSFIPEIFAAAFESRGGEFTRWMPWCHENYAIADTVKFVAYAEEMQEKGLEYNFAIFDKSDLRFTGMISLNQYNFQHNLINLGYWIRVSAQKRGTASAAARLLAATAFQDLTINRIEILAAVENLPSRKAAEKAGAKYEGILRKRLMIGDRNHDAALFSYIREDFEE